MRRQHGGGYAAGCPAVAVAGVAHAGPRDRLAETVLANAALAEQHGIYTQQAVVVQGLHHRDPRPCRRVVGGRRDQGEGVVEMRQVGPYPSEQGAKLTGHGPPPHGAGGKRKRVHVANRVIMQGKPRHAMPPGFKQRRFGAEHLIFAARSLVVVVDQDYR